MADYNITLADGTTIITIPEGSPLTSYTIPLVGQNTTTYGDDVAQAFLHLLENFASATDPANNSALAGSVPNTVLPGQLWYDSGNGLLKVNTSATATTSPTWSSLASTAQGATTDSTLRWNGTAWVEASRVRSSAAGVFSIWEAGGTPTDNVSFTHNGTDFVVSSTNTASIQVGETGTRFYLPSTSDASLASTDHPFQIGLSTSTNMRIDNNEIIAINNGAQSDLNLQTEGGNVVIGSTGGTGSIYLRARSPDGASVAGLGQIWVNSGDGELWFTGDDDVPHQVSNVSAGGTVGGTGANNQIATWSGASTLDGSANLTFDGTTFQFNSSAFGQFIIDRVSPTGGSAIGYQNDDGIKGYAGFNDAGEFEVYTAGATSTGFVVSQTGNATAQGFYLGDNDNLVLGSGSDVLIDFDGTNMVVNAAGATEIQVSGADLVLSNQTLMLDDIPNAEERITFKTTNATAGGQIGWRDSSNNLEANIFYYAGLMTVGATSTTWITGSNSEVRVASDIELWPATGVAALGTITPSSSYNSKGFVANPDSSTKHPIGYNVTPLYTLPPSATFTLDRQRSSYYLSKDGVLASSTVQCPQNTSIPVGTTYVVANDGITAGTISITQGAGTSLQWLDGSGAPPTGNRTLAIGGVCTIRKATNSGTHRWTIWGTGLS